MRMISLFLFFLVVGCSTPQTVVSAKTPRLKPKVQRISRDVFLRSLVKKVISRKGTFSTVTNGDITTETYRRKKSSSLFTFEKGELRTETEKMKGGKTLVRTWQNGILTTLTLSGSKRTTLVLLDGEGHFIHKIVTEKGKAEPECTEYDNGETFAMDQESCLELLSGFD